MVRTMAMMLLVGVIAFILGTSIEYYQVKQRALTINKECYNSDDLEYIITGKSGYKSYK